MKLKRKTRISLFLVLFFTAITVFILFITFFIHERLIWQRYSLRTFCRHIEQLSKDHNLDSIKKMIDISKGLHYRSGEFSYEIYDENEFRSSNKYTSKIQNELDEEGEYRSVDWNIDLAHQKWVMHYFSKQGRYIIYCQSKTRYDLVENLAPYIVCVAVFIGVIVMCVTFMFTKKFNRVISKITNYTNDISDGNFDTNLKLDSTDAELVVIETTLNSMAKDLNGYFTRLNNFTYDAAHELKTPLTSVVGEMDLALNKQRTAEEYQSLIVKSIEQLRSLAKLIDDMLFLVKPASSFDYRSFPSISLIDIVLKNVERYEFMAETKGVSISYNKIQNKSIKGMERVIDRMVSNLLHNSLKFAYPGTTILMETIIKNDRLEFSIKDSGCGIKDEDIDKIFDRFYTKSNKDDDSQQGQGLGLAIVKHIADIHRCELTVMSEYGKGTCIIISFPITGEEDAV